MDVTRALTTASHLLGGYRHHPKMRRLSAALEVGVVAAGAYELGMAIVRDTRSRRGRTIIVNSEENYDVFHPLMGWLSQFFEGNANMRLVLERTRVRDTEFDKAIDESLWIDARGTKRVPLEGGHYALVEVNAAPLYKDRKRVNLQEVRFTVHTPEAYAAVKKLLSSFLNASRSVDRPVYVSSEYDWEGSKRRVRRRLETVHMRSGQREALMADLESFLAAEGFYEDYGIPWHRGYLFYGPPGTGKSSLAEAIAHYTNRALCVLSLASVGSDSSLVEIMGNVPGDAIVVIEDVDTLQATESRESVTSGKKSKGGDRSNITLGGLLNVLDGATTPHGVIVVMTTNHVERLDPALTRAGRVDYTVHMDYVTQEHMAEMYAQFGGRGDAPALEREDVTPGEIVEAFKTCRGDVEGFENAVRLLVAKQQAADN